MLATFAFLVFYTWHMIFNYIFPTYQMLEMAKKDAVRLCRSQIQNHRASRKLGLAAFSGAQHKLLRTESQGWILSYTIMWWGRATLNSPRRPPKTRFSLLCCPSQPATIIIASWQSKTCRGKEKKKCASGLQPAKIHKHFSVVPLVSVGQCHVVRTSIFPNSCRIRFSGCITWME